MERFIPEKEIYCERDIFSFWAISNGSKNRFKGHPAKKEFEEAINLALRDSTTDKDMKFTDVFNEKAELFFDVSELCYKKLMGMTG